MSELKLAVKQENGEAELQLAKGDVRWLSGPAPAFKNRAEKPGRFVVLEMK